MWIAFFVMIGFYAFMFLVLRGATKIGNDIDDDMVSQQEQEDERESKKIAYLMLFYPAVYLFCIAPMSISRWIDWSRPNHHSAAGIIFSHVIFSLSGVFNVILFSITRPSLVAGSAESFIEPEGAVMRQQHPSIEKQHAPSYRYEPTTGTNHFITGKEIRPSKDNSLSSTIDISGEHGSDRNQLPRLPLQTRVANPRAVKKVHKGRNHGRLPDC